MRLSSVLALTCAFAIGLSSCSHATRHPAQQAACSDIDSCKAVVEAMIASADPTSPVAKLKDAANPPFALYPGEEWTGKPGGIWSDERNGYVADMAEILLAQQQMASAPKGTGAPSRVFHFKQHACVIGEMTILPMKDRKGDKKGATNHSFLHVGNGQTSYMVIARFSNGVGVSQNDNDFDVRGMAIKIFGVTNQDPGQPGDQKEMAVDFNMTNSPVAFGDVQSEFVDFLKSQIVSFQQGENFFERLKKDFIAKAGFAKDHARATEALISAIDREIGANLADRQYWAGHPYLLGDAPANATAMKLNLKPILPHIAHLPFQPSPNYLRHELANRLYNDPVKFTLQVQLDKNDPSKTPIEANLTEWKETASPSIPVAILTFPPQIIHDPHGELELPTKYDDKATGEQHEAADEVDRDCQSMSFTPAHSVAQDRPLSNMGRGRMFAYAASQAGRGANPTVFPDNQTQAVEQVRALLGRISITQGK